MCAFPQRGRDETKFRASLLKIPFEPAARRVSGVLFHRRIEGSGKFRCPRVDFADVRRSPRDRPREETNGHVLSFVKTSLSGCFSFFTACHAKESLLCADMWFTVGIFVERTSSTIGTRSLIFQPVAIRIALFNTTWYFQGI